MDRRTLVQLMGVLAAARPAISQDRGGRAPAANATPQGGGRGQQPMRVTKEQIVGALKLMGLEFSDPEIDMMLPRVNQALGNYEALRRIEIGYGVEPAFHFAPGLANRT